MGQDILLQVWLAIVEGVTLAGLLALMGMAWNSRSRRKQIAFLRARLESVFTSLGDDHRLAHPSFTLYETRYLFLGVAVGELQARIDHQCSALSHQERADLYVALHGAQGALALAVNSKVSKGMCRSMYQSFAVLPWLDLPDIPWMSEAD